MKLVPFVEKPATQPRAKRAKLYDLKDVYRFCCSLQGFGSEKNFRARVTQFAQNRKVQAKRIQSYEQRCMYQVCPPPNNPWWNKYLMIWFAGGCGDAAGGDKEGGLDKPVAVWEAPHAAVQAAVSSRAYGGTKGCMELALWMLSGAHSSIHCFHVGYGKLMMCFLHRPHK